MYFGYDSHEIQLLRVLNLQRVYRKPVVDLMEVVGELRLLVEIELEIGEAEEGIKRGEVIADADYISLFHFYY
jgi:hypothetical protein